MGIISDFLEDNRERMDFADPCIPVDVYIRQRNCIDDIAENMQRYDSCRLEKESALLQQLISQIEDLEKIISEYLEEEKYILYLQRHCNFKSVLVRDILTMLMREIKTAYYTACDVKQMVINKLGAFDDIDHGHAVDSKECGRLIIKLFMVSLIMSLQKSNEVMNTAEFRSTVHDAAAIIGAEYSKEAKASGKDVVQQYLLQETLAEKGHKYCRNCGCRLYRGISYCFNCYERN